MDIAIIGYIVTVIGIRGRIQGIEPYGSHPQRSDIFQFIVYTVEISYAVTVAVTETPDPDLIEYSGFIPVS
jgi:hypothetical protein